MIYETSHDLTLAYFYSLICLQFSLNYQDSPSLAIYYGPRVFHTLANIILERIFKGDGTIILILQRRNLKFTEASHFSN